ncbi:unnamed protein product [Phyllotreta striolata]|uniref:Nuclear pore complex protein Nup205 n=1 Tax=Phyllotreta striolata TaxID=444603 RepID=A0A9P0DR31_PHYSR|nr:unnamed protein product [Phyllotreta striolata]
MNEGITLDKTEDLWKPYKDLRNTICRYFNQASDELNTTEFETALRRHKQNFISLLQNPPKNPKAREALKQAMVDGISVRGIGHQIITKELYQESIILSDMFHLNELVALDLLCTAQIQMSFYPSLPRGLVAVLLYYDGRKALVNSLLYLVQARSGVQWTINLNPNVIAYITDYTNQLLEAGLFNKIFDLLRSLDLSKELEILHANLAIGGPKHRRQVVDLFESIKRMLAEIVFLWATQSGLPKTVTISLVNHLRDCKIEEEASGKVDDVNMYLEMAFLAALDISVLYSREDGEAAVQSLPIFSDSSFIPSIVEEFSLSKSKWLCEGLQALSMFGVAICLSTLRDIPQSFRYQEAINKEDALVDAAIEMNVFTFLHNVFLENKTLYKEEFLYKRMHNLIAAFIFSMYPKVKDMKMKADEIGRTMQVYIREGLEVSANLPRHFEYLLLTVGKIYANDTLKADYMLNYWSPIEINANQQSSVRAAPRCVSLFKFIRMAGEVIPSTLFVPYVTMLSGLSSSQQTARHCFNMLKQVGSHVSANLSWDHFFMSFSQYYNSLRQEVPVQADTVYMSRPTYHKAVTQQELEGLHAVLLLIRTIAEHDEFSRLAFCEHPGWSPLTNLLGLICCSVPIPLKADLLLTLAALCKSSENASQMWENLEASQILVTVPSTSSYAPRGIQTELEEIESRLEEYPLTKAILKLLDELTNFGIPRTLGAGPREPGFEPYLSFIINSVFLKHHSRSYRNVSDKWEIALLCTKLFEKFLNQYDPSPGEFNNNKNEPGYHLMLQLNSKSELFRAITNLIYEGNRVFETYVTYSGENIIRASVLSALKIVRRVLVLQPKFFSLVVSSSSTMLTSMSKLLFSINAVTNKPDHCVNIMKYVIYQQSMPEHSYVAVKIMNHITGSCVMHKHFMNILLSTDDCTEIMNGFVKCLDASSSSDDECADLVEKTKKEILKLLKQCLTYNPPNLSLFLLGFDLKRDVSKTEFQYPGVLGFPRTCFHSVLWMMDNNTFETPSNSLLESAYHLLYLLASDSKTSGPILRFIRQDKTFYRDRLTETRNKLDRGGSAEFGQLTWLLKVLAIELKVLSQLKQVSYLKQLTNFLVNLPPDESSVNRDMFAMVQVLDRKFTDNLKMDNFLTDLIKHFELNAPAVEMPQWEYFNNNVLNDILKSCRQDDGLIDLKKLHQILYDELKTLQGTSVMGQIQAITQEIQKVLRYALKLNERNETCAIITRFTDSWRQITEVLLISTPPEILSTTEQQIVSIALLRSLLKNVTKSELLPEVCRLLSGCVVILTDNLNKCYSREKKIERFSKDKDKEMFVDVLKLYYTTLKEILENLISWIVTSDVVNCKLRVNLYTALVSFLQLTCEDKNLFVNSIVHVMPTEVLNTFGDKLIEIICQDCIGGPEICKILAMSCFTHLTVLTGHVQCTLLLSGRGYLKHIIQSIADSEDDLKNILDPRGVDIKPLYLYTAKMLLLTRLAGNKMGSELLLEQKLLTVFSNMTVFTYHPEISKIWDSDGILEEFLPPAEKIYLEIWLPTLHICNAVLTTLGTENQSAVAQIMYFLLSHVEVVELILRSGCVEIAPMSLKELALLTSILARTTNTHLLDNRSQLHRIHKLMLSLLPKFILTEGTVRNLTGSLSNLKYQTSDRLLYVMQIISNLLSYSKNVCSNSNPLTDDAWVVFYPTLNDPLLSNVGYRNLSNTNELEPSLGVVVQQLISTVNFHREEKVVCNLLKRKLDEVPDMNSADLMQFVDDVEEIADLNAKKEKAFVAISESLDKKTKVIDYCCFVIECSLYLIWSHLDFYMLKAIPKVKSFEYSAMHPGLKSDGTLASASEATWKVSTDTISNLKQGLVSLFNDSFTKQLLETTHDRSTSDKGFIEALLRKIKRLVQFVPVK